VQLGGAAARPIVGRWSDMRQDRAGLMAAVAVAAAIAVVELALAASATGPALVAAIVLAGVATLSWNGLAALTAGEVAPPDRAGAALGWQTTAVFGGGAVIAPIFATLVSATSWTLAFAALALPALGAGWLMWPLRRRHWLDADDERDLMQRALASMSSAISLIDVREESQPIVYVNAAFERLTGYVAAEVMGGTWTLLEGAETDPGTAAKLRVAVERGEELRLSIRHHRRNGHAYWSETLMAPVYGEGDSVTHYMAVQKDITARLEAQHRAAHLAYHDSITGLPNRTQLQEHLSIALARADRGNAAAALLFLDLDGFKGVNDRHGHDAGDQVLADVARRWSSIARDGDVLARYGGDEFALLLSDLPVGEVRDITAAARLRYTDALRLPFDVQGAAGQVVSIGVSVGIAVYPDDAASASALLLAADEAMYAAKRAGGSAGSGLSRGTPKQQR
jgi:diguanylate cyclase (GGDEF)-like protein/PAS domain S-box-containing protein